MIGNVHGPIRGRGPSFLDWLMLAFSFATILLVVAAQ